MRRPEQAGWRAIFAAAMLALLLAGAHARASTPAENRDWNSVRKSMDEAQFTIAETNLANFVKTYPESEHYAEAILYQAQARFRMAQAGTNWSYADVISLLTSQQDRAGNQADRFAYLVAEARYCSSDFRGAAEGYAQLVQEHTNSAYRLEAIFNQATAYSKLGDWPRVVNLLREPEGPFQQAVRTNANDPWAVRGLFLLAEAELTQKNPAAAEEALGQLPAQKLDSDLEWKRQYLVCRIKLEGGHAEEALQNGSNLLAAVEGADLADRSGLKARSMVMIAELHRSLEHWTNAIAAYQTNLTSDLPEERRLAMLNIVELNLRQGRTDEAAKRLDEYLLKYPEERARDFGMLALGELRLKQHFEATAEGTVTETNYLHQARTNFLDLLTDFTNSPYAGKAQLNLGWCWLEDRKYTEAQEAFSNALRRLPVSEDRAVAAFKLADVQFTQKDFARAVTNYESVIDQYGSFTAVKNDLFEQALYQILRAGAAVNNFDAATKAMRRLLEWFPGGPWGESGALLVGQALDTVGRPAEARAVFTEFLAHWPDSGLRPEVELAIARTYEGENNWEEAGRRYSGWIAGPERTNHPALPRAEFSLAWAEFKAGNQPRALSLFTNFLSRYPTNELAPKAQFWIGDFYLQQSNWTDAEKSYLKVTNWPTSDLTYLALMRAGRAAVGRQGYSEAIDYYFTPLATNASCPLQLRLEALFAKGDAKAMQAGSSTTNLPDWKTAAGIFSDIAKGDPSNSLAPCAIARMGDCYLQLATQDPAQYLAASNAYEQVMASPLADISLRSMAEYGLGQALEKLARVKQSPEAQRRPELARLAVEHYLRIVNGDNLRENESPDRFWLKEAGLAAGTLLEDREWGDLEQADNLYRTLKADLPEMQPTLDRKLENLRKRRAEKANIRPVN